MTYRGEDCRSIKHYLGCHKYFTDSWSIEEKNSREQKRGGGRGDEECNSPENVQQKMKLRSSVINFREINPGKFTLRVHSIIKLTKLPMYRTWNAIRNFFPHSSSIVVHGETIAKCSVVPVSIQTADKFPKFYIP